MPAHEPPPPPSHRGPGERPPPPSTPVEVDERTVSAGPRNKALIALVVVALLVQVPRFVTDPSGARVALVAGGVGALVFLSIYSLTLKRRFRRLEDEVRRERPHHVLVVGVISAEAVTTLKDRFGTSLGGFHAFGGARVALAGGPDGIELWWRRRGRLEQLLALPWHDLRLVRGRTNQGVRRMNALALTPADPSAADTRIPIMVTRSIGFRLPVEDVDAAIVQLESVRPR